jgi:glycosyltransferase involved in cell wall biosynthesis
VLSVSSAPSRYRRAAEIVGSVWRERHRLDALILECYGGPSFVVEDAASLVASRARLPLVMHLHGGAMPTFMARHPRWTRRVLGRAHALVTPSPFLAAAVEPYGVSARVIPNVIDLNAYPFRLRTVPRPRLLWMRSFHELYNPLLAVRVLALVRERLPEATLVMAGQEKGLGAATRAEAERLGLGGAIRFPGFLGPDSKLREGDAADVFLNTNRVDNAPVALLEAAAMGLPIVSTDVGGVRYLVRDDHTALLAPDDDAPALAAAVVRLLTEPGLAERLGRGARCVAEQSAAPAVASAWRGLLDEVIGGARERAA